MALILSLETATKTCSVALAKDGVEIKTTGITTDHFSHGENLNLFIQSLFEGSGYVLADLDAVAVSEGPGSYTGLRIGASTAKGICYALDKPLIGINSLKALANLISHETQTLICPMFDAMRMEVYAAVFSPSLDERMKTTAMVIDEHSFEELLANNTVLFIGPGAEKCKPVIRHENALFDTVTEVSAAGMMAIAEEKFKAGQFENVAYFEPFYLKDFVAGAPKKLI